MDKCREEFEKLPSISTFLPGFKFNETTNEYERSGEFTLPEYTLGFFNGAWYAFQHQQAKVEELQKRVGSAISNIEHFFDEQTQQPTQREYANFLADVLHDLKLEQALKGEG